MESAAEARVTPEPMHSALEHIREVLCILDATSDLPHVRESLELAESSLEADPTGAVRELQRALGVLQRLPEADEGWSGPAVTVCAEALGAAFSYHRAQASTARSEASPVGERRTTRRVAIEVQVDLLSDTQFFAGHSEDLSDAGVFVATYIPKPVGTEVTLSIELDEDQTLEMTGRVAWLRDGSDDAPPGMGVAFEKLDSRERDTIQAFLRQRPPLFWDT